MGKAKNKGLGKAVARQPRAWVQTDRASHEAWAQLITNEPRAAQLMHILCAHIGTGNAVLIAQKTLAKLMGCSERTVRNALPALVRGRWLQVVQIGHHGTINAYVINDRVAWTESRDDMPRLSMFSAEIVADAEDQPPETMETTKLRRLPMIVPPEEALPVGEGEPGAQIALPGMEPVVTGAPAPANAEQQLQQIIPPKPAEIEEMSEPLDRLLKDFAELKQRLANPVSDDQRSTEPLKADITLPDGTRIVVKPPSSADPEAAMRQLNYYLQQLQRAKDPGDA